MVRALFARGPTIGVCVFLEATMAIPLMCVCQKKNRSNLGGVFRDKLFCNSFVTFDVAKKLSQRFCVSEHGSFSNLILILKNPRTRIISPSPLLASLFHHSF